jgi:hypothetical protein
VRDASAQYLSLQTIEIGKLVKRLKLKNNKALAELVLHEYFCRRITILERCRPVLVDLNSQYQETPPSDFFSEKILQSLQIDY